MLAFYLAPYEFSAVVVLSCLVAGVVYGRGAALLRREGRAVAMGRSIAFYLGLILMYAVMQTYVDYLSQHMFWVHRAQHLVLHHLAPFLIMLSLPQAVMARGLPAGLYERVVAPVWYSGPTQAVYRFIQQPIVASVLFVGLIYFWLQPDIHFDAMLSVERYNLMNWSMAIDGLLFWWLIVDPRSREQGGLSYGIRIVILWLIMFPQIAIGAYIALSETELYDVYNVCGRAWPLSPLVDQQIGGLITWIPASMMSVIATVVVLRFWMRANARTEQPRADAPNAA